MLNLLRLSMTCSSLALLLLASGAIYFVSSMLEDSFVQNASNSNRTLSWSIANTATPLLPPVFSIVDNYAESPSLILETPEVRKLDAAISREVLGTPVREISVRDPHGRIIYSTSAYLLNKRRLDSGFKTAMTGEENTRYAPLSEASPQGGGRQVRDYFTTYLPILNSGDNSNLPEGVISVTVDHTEYHKQTQQQQWLVSALVVSGLLLLYSILIFFLWRIRRQYIQDYSRHQQLRQELEHSNLHDPLTGLPNRQQFMDKIELLCELCHNVPHESFAVLLTDLDSFKVINESLGHEAGNQLLREVAIRLQQSIRPSDMIARLGGDEFGIIVEKAKGVSEVIDIAKRINQQFGDKFKIKGHQVAESTSIGITICEGEGLTPQDIVRDADIAMSRAKREGRGRYELFNKQMHNEAMYRIEIEGEIRRGIEAGEFFNRYHPIVDLNTGLTASLEALVRWAHPSKRELAPNHFVGIAEEIGLIDQIDRQVLTAAAQELGTWRHALPELAGLAINVNHSAYNFSGRPAIDFIFSTLRRNGLEGSSLKLELTESSILKNEVLASNMFEELRDSGIHLCMDDFGTGFSSLSYLRKMQFDMLKIDMSFVRDMLDSEEARKIVRTIVEMGQNLGIAVTAEGVETEEQVQLLKQMGCRYAQGFYFAKPLRADEVVPFLRAQLTAAEATQQLRA